MLCTAELIVLQNGFFIKKLFKIKNFLKICKNALSVSWRTNNNQFVLISVYIIATIIFDCTKQCLTCTRKSDGSEKEYNVKKSFFNSKEASYIDFGDGVGYIKLNSFTGTAAEDFVSCADAFKKNGNSKLILDLRDNGGGSTNILSVIASYLIHYGDKDESNGLEIIRLKSEKTQETISYTAEGNNWLGKGMNGNFNGFNIVVVIIQISRLSFTFLLEINKT